MIASTKWRQAVWLPRVEFADRKTPALRNRQRRGYYQQHDRLLARVALSRLDYNEQTNTVTPTLTIDPGPLVKGSSPGCPARPTGKLRQLLPIYQEHSVDRSLLEEGRRNLVEYFQSQGYFDVDVSFRFPGTEGNERTIEYNIVRRERHKLVRIDIEGNNYFDSTVLRERMYIMPASFLRFRHGRYSERYLSKDVDSIQDLYRSNGFRDVRVVSSVDGQSAWACRRTGRHSEGYRRAAVAGGEP